MKRSRQWQARFHDSIGGITFAGARRRGRGEWMRGDEVPQEVREFLNIVTRGQGCLYRQPDWKKTSEMEAAMGDEIQRHYRHRGFLVLIFRVDEDQPVRSPGIDLSLPKLRDVLRSMNDGRNLRENGHGCFDVLSFDFKDADLEPDGCKGISELLGVEGKRVVVEVSGHKTFCASEDPDDPQNELALEILCQCGSDCEWDGDSWCASFVEIIKVPVVHQNGIVDYDKTAKRIIRKAEQVCQPYAESWASTEEALNEVFSKQ